MKEFIETIRNYNSSEICIITDFDDTLTKGLKENGSRGSNSFSVFLNNSDLLGEEYSILTNKLFDKYYAIEQDPKISNEKKIIFMIEWWEKEFELYQKYGLNKDTFIKIVKNKLIELKRGVEDFFILTNKKKIDTIIFSAGIYNLIYEFLRKINCEYSNVHVVANIFEFNENGDFISTKGDFIHSQNKNFEELSHLPVYSNLESKKLCIVLGDSVSDMNMVKGANFEKVISVGFLNKLPTDSVYEERFEAHKKTFDIVLDGREDFTKIIELIKEVK